MKTLRTTLALLALTLASSAMADETSGFYIGANGGVAKSKVDEERIRGGLQQSGYTMTSLEDDDLEAGYKVFGGYQFMRNFAIESGYFDLGRFDFTAHTQPPGSLSGEAKFRGLNFDALLILPFTSRFSVFGRGGVTYAEAQTQFSSTGAVPLPNYESRERAANYKFGAGLEYDFVDAFGMRLEAERYRLNDGVGNKGDVDFLSAGFLYRFGKGRPEPEPVQVVMAPPPPPPPAPEPPPPPQPRRVTFSSDALFAFDSDVLLPSGQRELDNFAVELTGTSFESVNITGHTDRIGSDAYNMNLSTRRAESVRRYLVDVKQFPGNRIMARGIGESEPVTRPGQCVGREKPRASQELKDCLQPDRRVEVVVTGTK